MQKQRDEALRQPLEPIAVRPELSVELGRKDEALEDCDTCGGTGLLDALHLDLSGKTYEKPMKIDEQPYESP